jgi:hypothetical protein
VSTELLDVLAENITPLQAEESMRRALEAGVGSAAFVADDRRSIWRGWEREAQDGRPRRSTRAEALAFATDVRLAVDPAAAGSET